MNPSPNFSTVRADLAKKNSDKLSFKNAFSIRTLLTNANKVKLLDYHVLPSDPTSKTLLLQFFKIMIYFY